MNNPPFNEWTPGFKASDAPVTPGDDPSSFADLDDAPPEAEPYSNSDIDTRKITVTFFRDEFAKTKNCVDLTLPQLAVHIRQKTATSKRELPWLKLALFGNKQSEKNCLRTNANTLQISGVEVEHDSGEIAFSTALATVLKAGIRCIIY